MHSEHKHTNLHKNHKEIFLFMFCLTVSISSYILQPAGVSNCTDKNGFILILAVMPGKQNKDYYWIQPASVFHNSWHVWRPPPSADEHPIQPSDGGRYVFHPQSLIGVMDIVKAWLHTSDPLATMIKSYITTTRLLLNDNTNLVFCTSVHLM